MFHDTFNIAILQGNMFGCGLSSTSKMTQLPIHDPDISTYECGSNNYYAALIAWSCIYALFGIFVLIVAYYGRRGISTFCSSDVTHTSSIHKLFDVASQSSRYCNSGMDHAKNVIRMMDILMDTSKLLLCMSVAVVCMYMPMYVALFSWYGTQSDSYAWVISIGYLSEKTPAIVIEIVIMLSLGIIVVVNRKLLYQHLFDVSYNAADVTITDVCSNSSASLSAGDRNLLDRPDIAMVSATISFCINFVLIVLLNYGYVMVLITGTAGEIFASQVGMAVIKTVWMTNGVPMLVFSSMKYVSYIFVGSKEIPDVLDRNVMVESSLGKQIKLLVVIAILNNIILPLLVFSVISPSCFYYSIVSADNINTFFKFSQCYEIIHAQCVSDTTVTVNIAYQPPFQYSYECSTAMITSYTPIYVMTSLTLGILFPILYIVRVKYVRERIQTMRTRMIRWIADRAYCCASKQEDGMSDKLKPSLSISSSGTAAASQLDRKYADSKSIITTVILNISIMATFGVAYPPLFLIMCVAFASYAFAVSVHFRCFIKEAMDSDTYILGKANEEYKMFTSLLIKSLWLLCPLVLTFFSFFVFDMVGDQLGFEQGIYASLPMVVLAMILLVSRPLYKKMYRQLLCKIKNNTSCSSNGVDDNVDNAIYEMRDTELADLDVNNGNQGVIDVNVNSISM